MNRLTVWGIALFICSIVIAPSTIVESVVTGSDKTVVEISIETYGINGCRNTTAHLTLQQYCALNEFIADFHAHLKSSTTQREFVQAYTECYFKLEQLHLLTLGFDSSGLGRTTVIRAGNNLAKKTNVSNYLCMVSGECQGVLSFSQFSAIPSFCFTVLIRLFGFPNFGIFLLPFMTAGSMVSFWSPIGVFSSLTFGDYDISFGDAEPSIGWVHSIGPKGNITYEGNTLWGQYPYPRYFMFGVQCFPGIGGFLGIKLQLLDGESFFIGKALWCSIGPNHPPWIY